MEMAPRTPSCSTLYTDLFLVPHLAATLYGPAGFVRLATASFSSEMMGWLRVDVVGCWGYSFSTFFVVAFSYPILHRVCIAMGLWSTYFCR